MSGSAKTGGSGSYYRRLRLAHDLSQEQFWTAVGATQSAGSRYEGGAILSPTLAELVRLTYVVGVDLAVIDALDMAAVELFKSKFPDRYDEILEKLVANRKKQGGKELFYLEGTIPPLELR